MKILVADDHSDTRDFLALLLEHLDHEVVAASNGTEALDLLREAAPPVALLDWMMPEMEGIEVCRRARADESLEGRYLILLTARAGPEDLVAGLEAGADDYLVKPVEVAELQARLHVAARVVGLQRRLSERIGELRNALDEVERLEGLVPICAYCKNVRTEQEYWQRVEQYVEQRSGVRFSHGICPSCFARLEGDGHL